MVMNSTENINQLPGSTKSADEELHAEAIRKIDELVSDGYRLYLSRDLEEASERLGEANALAVDLYGQFAPECYKPHFYYGLTLLEIVRNEVTLVKAPNNFEYDERFSDEFSEEVARMQRENDEKDEMEDGEELVNNDENFQMQDELHSQNVTGPSNQINPTENNQLIINADEISNINTSENRHYDLGEYPSTEVIAWESLEVARKICEGMEISTNSAEEWLEKKVEVLIALSECSMLAEEYNRAIDDLNTALQIQARLNRPHRRTAEIHYHIGRCYRSLNNFGVAAITFEAAKKELETLIDITQAKITDPSDEQFNKDKEEIISLKTVVKEVEESIQDANDSEKFREKQKKAQKNIITKIYHQIVAENDVITNDISSHVRRSNKRKLEETNQILEDGDAKETESRDIEENEPNNAESQASEENEPKDGDSQASEENEPKDGDSQASEENDEKIAGGDSNANPNNFTTKDLEPQSKKVKLDEEEEPVVEKTED